MYNKVKTLYKRNIFVKFYNNKVYKKYMIFNKNFYANSINIYKHKF